MDKRKFTTKQVREQHIQNFLASGKSQVSWCTENNIPYSTFNKWLHNYRASQQEVKFIPLAPKQNTSQQFHSNEILIEIGICRLHVPETLGIQFMQQAIRAVSESNVPIQ